MNNCSEETLYSWLTKLCSLIAGPNFVSSFAYEDYVFFFYRETAVEYMNCGKVKYFFKYFLQSSLCSIIILTDAEVDMNSRITMYYYYSGEKNSLHY